jgi:2-polyprenyl-3-methyl-5-hydroxy-6-metoxy-1,4-benzoquinol methylase
MNSDSIDFWNRWNAENREQLQGDVSHRQAEVVLGWLAGRSGLFILEAGCGSGWMAERLTEHGRVVATDLPGEVIERAQERLPSVQFVGGDVMAVDVGSGFDVVVTLEVLSHVADQPAFMRRLFGWLKPAGQLMLATQNKQVLSRFNRIPNPAEGQLRRWVDRDELRQLATDAGFRVDEVFVVSPKADHGIMRFIAKAGRMTRTSRLLERLGFGWTIMLRATRPS